LPLFDDEQLGLQGRRHVVQVRSNASSASRGIKQSITSNEPPSTL
jgi:hypothetical protein